MNLEFLHRMAHELKTPLTVISGYAQLTGIQLAADQVDQETPENPKTIRQEARRLGDMVTRLMEYSYGRTSELRFERVDTADLLDRVRAIAAPTAPEAEGWTFLGWYREASCENAWNFDTDLVEGSMTLYAGVGAADRCPPRAPRGRPVCAPTEKKRHTLNVLWERESPRRFAAPPFDKGGLAGGGYLGAFSCSKSRLLRGHPHPSGLRPATFP